MSDIDTIVALYGDMLYRICLFSLRSRADAEDALQETYLKYIRKQPEFKSEEHCKAWFIKVAMNQCRDILRRNRIRAAENIDRIADIYPSESFSDEEGVVFEILMHLPSKYSSVMILHFVEGYDYKTIASMIGRTESAIKMRIQKGRRLFEQQYRKEI